MHIALLGDLSANDAILDLLKRGEDECVVRDVPATTRQCRLVLANLEACWDIDGQARPAGPPGKVHIRTDPNVIRVLKRLNVSVVSVANNHSFDFGYKGWKALDERLNQEGIQSVGGGVNLMQAARPAVVEQEGYRIGILAYADRDCGAILASENTPGANPLDCDRAERDIRQLKKNCDCVIVSVHWGEERINMPAPKLRNWASAFAAAGADVIAGHHPHVLQGYERLGTCNVFYSLGNFLLADIRENGRWAARYCGPNKMSSIPLLELTPDRSLRVDRIVGVRSTGRGVRLADSVRFHRTWRKLCQVLQAVDYEKEFFAHQDFMWRYYIPIRYRLMQEPIAVLRRCGLQQLSRLFGFGASPWLDKSA
ncbi:MAG: CapA family protein [Planctomycetes bacterium]|nr:CapA family protein [Planctomycetota bacterium]